ncbi:MAG: hypothetical protein ACQEP5_02275 [Actinomycetota bacterium]
MRKKRLNITVPEKIAEALNAYNNKSRFISEAVSEKIERDIKKKTDAILVEGYKKEYESDKKLNEEWEDITLEGWPG